MTTPIVDFLYEYSKKDIARFHMPGHKGRGFLGCEHMDITEVHGADDLFAADGIIKESELNASKLFNSRHTFYSTVGSSSCIKAMVHLVGFYGKSKKILAVRNAHKSFFHACALTGLEPVWMYPKQSKTYYAACINAEEVRTHLLQTNAVAVYVTSPDYLGNTADIRAISEVCHEHKTPLIVDNAHGAYFAFLHDEMYAHPMAAGADMCCDSAHKTLPVLTPGAYLHVNYNAQSYEDHTKSALSLFSSTSPSYLVLASLDGCNRMLSEGYDIVGCAKNVGKIKEELAIAGIHIEKSDPLRIVINAAKIGYTGGQLYNTLEQNGIVCEYGDNAFTVLMITPNTKEEHFARLLDTFGSLELNNEIVVPYDETLPCETVLTPREAMLKKSRKIAVLNAKNLICASPIVSCPPAVPIVMGGERISSQALDLLVRYGVTHIDVVE